MQSSGSGCAWSVSRKCRSLRLRSARRFPLGQVCSACGGAPHGTHATPAHLPMIALACQANGSVLIACDGLLQLHTDVRYDAAALAIGNVTETMAAVEPADVAGSVRRALESTHGVASQYGHDSGIHTALVMDCFKV